MAGSPLRTPWEHPWLVGDPQLPGRILSRRARWTTIVAVLLANSIGAGVLLTFAIFALPKPDDVLEMDVLVANLVLAGVYVSLAFVVGVAWGLRWVEGGRFGVRPWLEADRPPSPDEQRRALRAPVRITVVQATLWTGATACFTVLNAFYDPMLALGVGLTVALGGVTTSTAAFLLSELALRPVTRRALSAGAPERRGVPGVAIRLALAWALGTGVPLVGIVLVGVVALTPVDIAGTTLAVTAIALGGIGLAFGFVVNLLAAYATAHPIGAMRRALGRVRAGDFEGELPVWDATEVGLLQLGFNEMLDGLRERERIRDLFGRQVGEDVARRALADGVDFAGEVRHVAVLFVDLTASTSLAAERPPQEVVALLNRFFAEVVDAVESHNGWVNKFEGDAALAVFGAPVGMDDPAGCCLATARDLAERLRARVPELDWGIGVAAGEVVAGNIGAERRFEYTVIGDPVNEAARLTELAKSRPGRVLASEAAVAAASEEEAAEWDVGDEVELRGRRAATRLACPR